MALPNDLSNIGSIANAVFNSISANATAVMSFTVSAIVANGSTGTANQVLTSNGTGLYWANTRSPLINDETVSAQSFYLSMVSSNSGALTNNVVSSTKLYFVPSTGTLNATIFNSLSDRAQKTNVSEIVDALQTVKSLRGAEFYWVDNNEKSAGVIAQDIEKTLPHLVQTSENGTKSVNYNGIIAYLIEAIKDLESKINKPQ